MTRPAGVATAVGVALDFADRIVLESVRDIHDAISGRVHSGVDCALQHKTVPHHVHDAIARAAFTSIGGSLRAGGWALRGADQVRGIGPALESSSRGQFVVSAINGLVGEQVAERAPAMAFDLTLRQDGHDVAPTRGDLAVAYPHANECVVVFVHGLCENENYWKRRARPVTSPDPTQTSTPAQAQTQSYGARLAEDLNWTPLFVRANTGASVREAGVALHALMAELAENWPGGVRRIALVGHSMGGLIIRAACDLESNTQGSWTDRVSDVIFLGTPHLGSPVERGIALGMRVANKVPELAPYRRTFMQRSAGVLDLSHGMPNPPRSLPNVRYRLVAATLTKTTEHPVAIGIGDMLVQPRSAFGQPVSGAELFPGADTLHVPNADHFDLLNHDDVYAAMRRWLTEPVSARM